MTLSCSTSSMAIARRGRGSRVFKRWQSSSRNLARSWLPPEYEAARGWAFLPRRELWSGAVDLAQHLVHRFSDGDRILMGSKLALRLAVENRLADGAQHRDVSGTLPLIGELLHGLVRAGRALGEARCVPERAGDFDAALRPGDVRVEWRVGAQTAHADPARP